MAHSNQQILTNFFRDIITVVSEGTSDSYAIMVISRFKKDNIKNFPFLEHVSLRPNGQLSSSIEVSSKVDSVNPVLVRKFLTKLISSLFSDLFKHLLKRKMSTELYRDLKELGVDI